MSNARLFVAVLPPPSVVDVLCRLPLTPDPAVKVVPAENWHITLRFVGDARPDDVAAALDKVSFPSCDVALGPTVEMLGDHSIVVPAHGAEALAERTNAATAHIGTPPRDRYVGHLTIARRRRSEPLSSGAANIGVPVRAVFTAESVCLVKSVLQPGGAQYEVLRRWRCVAEDAT